MYPKPTRKKKKPISLRGLRRKRKIDVQEQSPPRKETDESRSISDGSAGVVVVPVVGVDEPGGDGSLDNSEKDEETKDDWLGNDG